MQPFYRQRRTDLLMASACSEWLAGSNAALRDSYSPRAVSLRGTIVPSTKRNPEKRFAIQAIPPVFPTCLRTLGCLEAVGFLTLTHK